MENIFSNLNLFKIIIKWRFHLVVITLIAVVLSVIFSAPWFIKPQYKSTAILYPSNLIPYSSETPTELMLQIFNSDDIVDSLIRMYDLGTHYEIEKDAKNYKSKVVKVFQSKVDIRKTEYESVIIEIMDVDPVLACNMVKSMVTLFNAKARLLQRDKSEEVLKIAQIQFEQKKLELDTLKTNLDKLRSEYGLLDYTVQVREASRAYYKTLSSAGSAKKTIENLQGKGGDFIYLSSLYYAATDAYNKLKQEYEFALKDVKKDLTYSNYITSPVPADKKTYPVRWLIVLISTVSAFSIALITILLVEKNRNNSMIES
ncbi:MAG TPA: hypothetical protein PLC59_03370 [Bacteroidales bacterium]|nr:hypothetical protein [Bacteroidales bacterium]